jgi:hypothetical protein
MDAPSDLQEHRTIDDAALWHVDLADIARQTDVPTEVLLDALITSTAPAADAAEADAGEVEVETPGARSSLGIQEPMLQDSVSKKLLTATHAMRSPIWRSGHLNAS